MIDNFDIEIVPLNEKTKKINIETPKTVSLKKRRRSKKEDNKLNPTKEKKINKEKQNIKKTKTKNTDNTVHADNTDNVKLKKEKKSTEKKNTNIQTEKRKPIKENKERTKKKTKPKKTPFQQQQSQIVKVNKVDSVVSINKKSPAYLLNNSVTISKKKSPKIKSPIQQNHYRYKQSHNSLLHQSPPKYNYKLIEAQRRKKEIEEQLSVLKQKQINRSNPVKDYFKNKKKSPPRKQITINPDYNFNIPQTTKRIETKRDSLKTKTKHELLKKKDALLKLKAKKTQKKQNMRLKHHNNNHNHNHTSSNFQLKYKSPRINSLEFKKQKLKEQRLLELKKTQLKKRNILDLHSKENEIKIMNDIKKEQQLIKKLQDEQYKLDKLQYMYIEQHKRTNMGIKRDNSRKKKREENTTKYKKNNKIDKQFSIKKKKYSVDGIPINEFKSEQLKNNILNNSDNIIDNCLDSDDVDTYNIDDFSNVEEFSTDYIEEIWEYNLNNEKYNDLVFDNNNNNNNGYYSDDSDDIDDSYNCSNNTDIDVNNIDIINKIKYRLISNSYIKKENSLSDNMLIILYKNLIKQKKILLL
jgi:hypothetical protein